jgi:hypothetical protein
MVFLPCEVLHDYFYRLPHGGDRGDHQTMYDKREHGVSFADYFGQKRRAGFVSLRRKQYKELHDLQLDRTSCSAFWANQFRVLLTSAAYVLMQELRRRAAGINCARTQGVERCTNGCCNSTPASWFRYAMWWCICPPCFLMYPSSGASGPWTRCCQRIKLLPNESLPNISC